MSEYTPTTRNIREAYIGSQHDCMGIKRAESEADFDRWLAAHDAEVRAKTLNAAADTFEWAGDDEDYTAFREWLRNRAGEQK